MLNTQQIEHRLAVIDEAQRQLGDRLLRISTSYLQIDNPGQAHAMRTQYFCRIHELDGERDSLLAILGTDNAVS